MQYSNTVKGIFKSRPNRFIAIVEIAGKDEICHVKNTGRCKELLICGCTVILEYCPLETRKTKYDLIAVYKGDMLINMDSQAPNKAAAEYLPCLFPSMTIKAETAYGNSRFDFYAESENTRAFIEVKGVTLEENGVVKFPDAPTVRGLKHIRELEKCVEDGYEAYILFVVQMSGIKCFTPNYKTHPEFGEELKRAENKGVKIFAVDCLVTEDSLQINQKIKVVL